MQRLGDEAVAYFAHRAREAIHRIRDVYVGDPVVPELLLVALLALQNPELQKKLADFRQRQTEAVLKAAPLKL